MNEALKVLKVWVDMESKRVDRIEQKINILAENMFKRSGSVAVLQKKLEELDEYEDVFKDLD